MQDTFITKIHINKVRHLTDVDIILSDTERRHLIITGKNGSGKTSLLNAMRDIIYRMQDYRQSIVTVKQSLNSIIQNSVDISYSQNDFKPIDVISVYIPAIRSSLILPNAIEPVQIKDKTDINVKWNL